MLHKFASAHASIHNHFNLERYLIRRQTFEQNRSAAPPSGVNSRHEADVPEKFGDWFALDRQHRQPASRGLRFAGLAKIRMSSEALTKEGLAHPLRPTPDTRTPAFRAEARRQSRAVARSRHAREDQSFIEAISEDDGGA